MQRYLVNAQAELSVTFYVSGVPTEPAPNTCNVTITRADGTNIVTNAVATPVGAPNYPVGSFTYTLFPNVNTKLDRLTVTWVSALGTIKTYAEIVGGFLIAAATLKELYPDDSDAKLADRRTDIETKLEKACGRAFVPRFEEERVRIDRRGRIRLKWGDLRVITSLATSTYTYLPSQITQLYPNWEQGIIPMYPLTPYQRDVFVSYEHGADYPGPEVENVMLAAFSEKYGPNKIDGRIRSKSVDNVSVTYAAQATERALSMEFTSPEVVSFILDNARPAWR